MTSRPIDADSIRRAAEALGRRLLYWVVTLGATGLAFVMAILAGDPTSRHRRTFIIIGVVSAIVGQIMPAIRAARARNRAARAGKRAARAGQSAQRVRDVALDVQARFNTAVGDIIAPIAQELAHFICAPVEEQRRLRTGLVQKILQAARELTGGTGVRASLYTYQVGPDGRSGDLVLEDCTGRGDRPRGCFQNGKEAGSRDRAVHDLVRSGSYDFQPDVAVMPDKAYYTGKAYQTYIAAAIHVGGSREA